MKLRIFSIAFIVAFFNSCDLAQFNGSSEVTIYWSAPIQRANGVPMDIMDIGGYEIRYRLNSEKYYQTILIRDSSLNQYTLSTKAPASTSIEVAVFDTDGIYSEFVLATEDKAH